MDFQGPLYDVRMSRGQGYNSYIQEVRVHNAVKITKVKKKPSAKSVASGNTEVNGISESSKPIAEPSKAAAAPSNTPAEPSKPAAAPPKPADAPPSWNEFFPALLDYMSKNNALAGKTADSKSLPYLMPAPSGKVNQTVLFSSKQVSEISDINRAMGFKASAAVKAASVGPGAEVSSNLASTDDFKGSVLNFLIHVKVVNEKPDREEEWEFKDIDGLEARLAAIKDEYLLAKLQKEHGPQEGDRRYAGHIAHLRSVEFTRIYGDTVISDFVEGGELYALVGIRSRKKAISNDLIAYASAQLTPAAIPITVKGEASVNKAGKEDFEQAETSIRVQWRGGGQIKNHDFAWGLDSLIQIANAFPTFVASTSAKIRAVLTPYSSVRSFQELQLKFPDHPLTLNYDRCALFAEALYEDYQAFRTMWTDIGSILASPEKYSARKETDKKAYNAQAAVEPGSELAGRNSAEMFFQDATEKQVDANMTGRRGTVATMDGTMAGRRMTAATVSVQDMASSVHGAGTSALAITDLAGILGLKKEPKLNSLLPTNTQQLSRLRLLCHSAMLHIQKLAADLVIDPHVVESHSDDHEGENIPTFQQPHYPYPGTIKKILPVPTDTGEGATPWDDSHYQVLADLHIPTSILAYPGARHPDDTYFAWNCYGDNLSDYKKYEHFQIGNFDPSNQQYPQAIALQVNTPSMIGYVNRRAKLDESMISGIAMRYWTNIPAKYSDLENTTVQDVKSAMPKAAQGENSGIGFAFCGGKAPASEQAWTQVSNEFDTAPFNRVCFYYKQGSGRISGLELHRDDEIDGQVQMNSEKTPVVSHISWKPGPKSPPPPPQFIAVPGDGIGANKLWLFAGSVSPSTSLLFWRR